MSAGVRMRKGMIKLPDPADEEILTDRRSEDLRHFATEDTVSLDALRDVFAGTDLIQDKEKVQFLLELRGEVRRHWGAARDSFLAMGAPLWPPRRDYRSLSTSVSGPVWTDSIPFGDAVASQLRRVARAVDERRIPEADCPGSYATAYQIAVLKPDELELAIAR